MALDNESDSGSSNTMLAMLVGAVLVIAVILFALGTFGANPNSLTNAPSKIEITVPKAPESAPAPAPTPAPEPAPLAPAQP